MGGSLTLGETVNGTEVKAYTGPFDKLETLCETQIQ